MTAPSADELRSRLATVIDDLLGGRITATEANRITKEVGRELDRVETALRAAKLTRS
jgi:hypothetical protein